MKIGFIGAGKVGFSFGKYFTMHQLSVSGYYSRNPQSAQNAAEFTQTKKFDTLEAVIYESDILFLTVPDDAIASVWEKMKQYPIAEKYICHCSGAKSSSLFSESDTYHVYTYSLHPILAISDCYESYHQLTSAFFTMEGNEAHSQVMIDIMKATGNPWKMITAEQKPLYHAACVASSNLMVGLMEFSFHHLMACGFTEEEAQNAFTPLAEKNLHQIMSQGTVSALTGPIERNDLDTVRLHLVHLNQEDVRFYQIVSQYVLSVAKRKHPDRDYGQMEELLS